MRFIQIIESEGDAAKELADVQGYAEMAKGALEKNSIPAFIKGDFLSTAYGAKTWDAAGGKAVLFVPEEELERAASILEEMTADEQ
jgi:hypothetical protein